MADARRLSAAPPRGGAALAALGALLLAACGSAAQPGTTPTTATPLTAAPLVVSGPGRYVGEVISGELLRRFVLVVPETGSRPVPVVIVFHGFAGSPRQVEELSAMTGLSEAQGFVVVYPEGAGLPRSWRADSRQGDRDVTFTRDLVALLDEAVGVEAQRIYAVGMSNGGGMAARLACDASDLVAAVGTVAAAYPGGACSPVRPVPVIAFHGTDDPIVPYEGWAPVLPAVEEWAAGWAVRNGCGSVPETEAFPPDVTRTRWESCADAADVVLYTVAGGRHGWPGSGRDAGGGASTDTVDASALLWEFFSAHPMR